MSSPTDLRSASSVQEPRRNYVLTDEQNRRAMALRVAYDVLHLDRTQFDAFDAIRTAAYIETGETDA